MGDTNFCYLGMMSGWGRRHFNLCERRQNTGSPCKLKNKPQPSSSSFHPALHCLLPWQYPGQTTWLRFRGCWFQHQRWVADINLLTLKITKRDNNKCFLPVGSLFRVPGNISVVVCLTWSTFYYFHMLWAYVLLIIFALLWWFKWYFPPCSHKSIIPGVSRQFNLVYCPLGLGLDSPVFSVCCSDF